MDGCCYISLWPETISYLVTGRLFVDCCCQSSLWPETTTYEVTGRLFVVRCQYSSLWPYTKTVDKSQRDCLRLKVFTVPYDLFSYVFEFKEHSYGVIYLILEQINLQLPNKCVVYYQFILDNQYFWPFTCQAFCISIFI